MQAKTLVKRDYKQLTPFIGFLPAFDMMQH